MVYSSKSEESVVQVIFPSLSPSHLVLWTQGHQCTQFLHILPERVCCTKQLQVYSPFSPLFKHMVAYFPYLSIYIYL